MNREIDLRHPDVYVNVSVDLDEIAGVLGSPLEGSLIEQALLVAQNLDQFGFAGLEDTKPPDFIADSHIRKTSSGAAVVNLQQQSSNLTLYQANQIVRFDPNGDMEGISGRLISVVQDTTTTLPELSVEQAVLEAARHVAEPNADEEDTDQLGEPITLTPVDLNDFVPTILASFPDLPEQPTVLERGPFGEEIKAHLIWFPMLDSLRLAWDTVITMPSFEGQFHIIVDAEDGRILYSAQLMSFVEARGNVHQLDGGGQRQMTSFPRPWEDFRPNIAGGLPPEVPATPGDWVDVDSTAGNYAIAHMEAIGPAIPGMLQNGILTFDPDPLSDDQKVLNAFYYSCYMHDYTYLLGFRELDGNFQEFNSGAQGAPGDRVEVQVYRGPVFMTANMSYPADGLRPVMRLGLVTSTNRHTALDSSIVFHEYFHGVSNRLVGGPKNSHAMEAQQSKGLGEGLSDYVACTINNSTVIGSWVKDNPNGIRILRYDENFPSDTVNFGSLGTDRFTRPHHIGEICCAILLGIDRQIESILLLQLVIDALKLAPANPSFLDLRNAMLRALDHKLAAGTMTSDEHSAAQESMWRVFAEFGMGPNASSNWSTLSGIVTDFIMPDPIPATPT